jgi:hypothetical protein
MRLYTVRRITPWSAVRVALTLGWTVALCPSIALAVLAAQLLRRAADVLGQVKPIELEVFGQQVASVDPLDALGLRGLLATLAGLVDNLPLTIVAIIFALLLLATVALALAALLFSLGYNLLAGLSGGIAVELDAERDSLI